MSTELQEENKKLPIMTGNKGLHLTGFDDMWRFAVAVSQSGMAPKGLEKPQSIFVAIQAGLEVGLPPMQAVQNIAVINGRPCLWGDAVKGLVDASGLCVMFRESYEGKPYNDDYAAVCECQREGQDPVRSVFSVAMAKKAKLWGKAGPWEQFPDRMLKARARAFALRDAFPDVIKGLRVAEEVQDYIDVTPSSPGTTTEAPEKPAKGSESADPLGDALAKAAAESAPQEPTEAPQEREPGDEGDEESELTGAALRIDLAIGESKIDAPSYDAICEELGIAGMDVNLLDPADVDKLEAAILDWAAGKPKKAPKASKEPSL